MTDESGGSVSPYDYFLSEDLTEKGLMDKLRGKKESGAPSETKDTPADSKKDNAGFGNDGASKKKSTLPKLPKLGENKTPKTTPQATEETEEVDPDDAKPDKFSADDVVEEDRPDAWAELKDRARGSVDTSAIPRETPAQENIRNRQIEQASLANKEANADAEGRAGRKELLEKDKREKGDMEAPANERTDDPTGEQARARQKKQEEDADRERANRLEQKQLKEQRENEAAGLASGDPTTYVKVDEIHNRRNAQDTSNEPQHLDPDRDSKIQKFTERKEIVPSEDGKSYTFNDDVLANNYGVGNEGEGKIAVLSRTEKFSQPGDDAFVDDTLKDIFGIDDPSILAQDDGSYDWKNIASLYQFTHHGAVTVDDNGQFALDESSPMWQDNPELKAEWQGKIDALNQGGAAGANAQQTAGAGKGAQQTAGTPAAGTAGTPATGTGAAPQADTMYKDPKWQQVYAAHAKKFLGAAGTVTVENWGNAASAGWDVAQNLVRMTLTQPSAMSSSARFIGASLAQLQTASDYADQAAARYNINANADPKLMKDTLRYNLYLRDKQQGGAIVGNTFRTISNSLAAHGGDMGNMSPSQLAAHLGDMQKEKNWLLQALQEPDLKPADRRLLVAQAQHLSSYMNGISKQARELQAQQKEAERYAKWANTQRIKQSYDMLATGQANPYSDLLHAVSPGFRMEVDPQTGLPTTVSGINSMAKYASTRITALRQRPVPGMTPEQQQDEIARLSQLHTNLLQEGERIKREAAMAGIARFGSDWQKLGVSHARFSSNDGQAIDDIYKEGKWPADNTSRSAFRTTLINMMSNPNLDEGSRNMCDLVLNSLDQFENAQRTRNYISTKTLDRYNAKNFHVATLAAFKKDLDALNALKSKGGADVDTIDRHIATLSKKIDEERGIIDSLDEPDGAAKDMQTYDAAYMNMHNILFDTTRTGDKLGRNFREDPDQAKATENALRDIRNQDLYYAYKYGKIKMAGPAMQEIRDFLKQNNVEPEKTPDPVPDGDPDPADPDPADPDPADPDPADPDPADPGPADPDPADPDPADQAQTTDQVENLKNMSISEAIVVHNDRWVKQGRPAQDRKILRDIYGRAGSASAGFTDADDDLILSTDNSSQYRTKLFLKQIPENGTQQRVGMLKNFLSAHAKDMSPAMRSYMESRIAEGEAMVAKQTTEKNQKTQARVNRNAPRVADLSHILDESNNLKQFESRKATIDALINANLLKRNRKGIWVFDDETFNSMSVPDGVSKYDLSEFINNTLDGVDRKNSNGEASEGGEQSELGSNFDRVLTEKGQLEYSFSKAFGMTSEQFDKELIQPILGSEDAIHYKSLVEAVTNAIKDKRTELGLKLNDKQRNNSDAMAKNLADAIWEEKHPKKESESKKYTLQNDSKYFQENLKVIKEALDDFENGENVDLKGLRNQIKNISDSDVLYTEAGLADRFKNALRKQNSESRKTVTNNFYSEMKAKRKAPEKKPEVEPEAEPVEKLAVDGPAGITDYDAFSDFLKQMDKKYYNLEGGPSENLADVTEIQNQLNQAARNPNLSTSDWKILRDNLTRFRKNLKYHKRILEDLNDAGIDPEDASEAIVHMENLLFEMDQIEGSAGGDELEDLLETYHSISSLPDSYWELSKARNEAGEAHDTKEKTLKALEDQFKVSFRNDEGIPFKDLYKKFVKQRGKGARTDIAPEDEPKETESIGTAPEEEERESKPKTSGPESAPPIDEEALHKDFMDFLWGNDFNISGQGGNDTKDALFELYDRIMEAHNSGLRKYPYRDSFMTSLENAYRSIFLKSDVSDDEFADAFSKDYNEFKKAKYGESEGDEEAEGTEEHVPSIQEKRAPYIDSLKSKLDQWDSEREARDKKDGEEGKIGTYASLEAFSKDVSEDIEKMKKEGLFEGYDPKNPDTEFEAILRRVKNMFTGPLKGFQNNFEGYIKTASSENVSPEEKKDAETKAKQISNSYVNIWSGLHNTPFQNALPAPASIFGGTLAKIRYKDSGDGDSEDEKGKQVRANLQKRAEERKANYSLKNFTEDIAKIYALSTKKNGSKKAVLDAVILLLNQMGPNALKTKNMLDRDDLKTAGAQLRAAILSKEKKPRILEVFAEGLVDTQKQAIDRILVDTGQEPLFGTAVSGETSEKQPEIFRIEPNTLNLVQLTDGMLDTVSKDGSIDYGGRWQRMWPILEWLGNQNLGKLPEQDKKTVAEQGKRIYDAITEGKDAPAQFYQQNMTDEEKLNADKLFFKMGLSPIFGTVKI